MMYEAPNVAPSTGEPISWYCVACSTVVLVLTVPAAFDETLEVSACGAYATLAIISNGNKPAGEWNCKLLYESIDEP